MRRPQGGQRLGQQQSWGPGPENLALALGLHGPDIVRHIHSLSALEQLLGEGQDLGGRDRAVREGAHCVSRRGKE